MKRALRWVVMNQKSVSDRNGAKVERCTIVDDNAAGGYLLIKPHR